MLSTLKNNAAAGYQGPVKKELLKGVGLLRLKTEPQTIADSLYRTKQESSRKFVSV